MKNRYFDELVAADQPLSPAQNFLIYHLQLSDKMLVLEDCTGMSPEFAVAMVQQLSLAEINDVYINSERSNQMDAWMAMDGFGMKLRGIEMVDNPRNSAEMRKWGSSTCNERIPAFHFSFI